MLMVPFELRARLEYIKAGKHGYWINDEPYWLASLAERAPGLHRAVMIPLEVPATLTREQAQEHATQTWLLYGVRAKWRKLPKRKQVSRLDAAVMGRATKGEQHEGSKGSKVYNH
jgi:hypothetical protein